MELTRSPCRQPAESNKRESKFSEHGSAPGETRAAMNSPSPPLGRGRWPSSVQRMGHVGVRNEALSSCQCAEEARAQAESSSRALVDLEAVDVARDEIETSPSFRIQGWATTAPTRQRRRQLLHDGRGDIRILEVQLQIVAGRAHLKRQATARVSVTMRVLDRIRHDLVQDKNHGFSTILRNTEETELVTKMAAQSPKVFNVRRKPIRRCQLDTSTNIERSRALLELSLIHI